MNHIFIVAAISLSSFGIYSLNTFDCNVRLSSFRQASVLCVIWHRLTEFIWCQRPPACLLDSTACILTAAAVKGFFSFTFKSIHHTNTHIYTRVNKMQRNCEGNGDSIMNLNTNSASACTSSIARRSVYLFDIFFRVFFAAFVRYFSYSVVVRLIR